MKQRTRQLYLIDWHLSRPEKHAEKPFTAKVDEKNYLAQLASLSFLVDDSKGDFSKVSAEELCVKYELYVKLLTTKRVAENLALKKKAQHEDRERLLNSVFGKKKKEEIQHKLATQDTDARLKQLAVPKDKWKRLKILLDLKKKFAHDITL
jgi:hypothetical protein